MTEHESKKVEHAKLPLSLREERFSPEREGLLSYFRHSWLEFKKVVWPERADAVKMTVFVLIFVGVLSAFIYAVDTLISWVFFDLLLKRG